MSIHQLHQELHRKTQGLRYYLGFNWWDCNDVFLKTRKSQDFMPSFHYLRNREIACYKKCSSYTGLHHNYIAKMYHSCRWKIARTPNNKGWDIKDIGWSQYIEGAMDVSKHFGCNARELNFILLN
jgi:hypothetical protein